MRSNQHAELIARLSAAYQKHAPTSHALNERAKQVLVDGGSHALRLIEPFPPRVARAQGAWIEDEDGQTLLDFWQGHYANLLGHNPPEIASALTAAFEEGFGLETGFADKLQVTCAELLCQQTGAERVRFTTSGTLATMYTILLARAFTGRDMVMKAGGGWHGAQPWGLKGVRFHPGSKDSSGPSRGFSRVETRGLPTYLSREVVVTCYNDVEMLEAMFREHGDDLACFVVEPVIGAGGFIAAEQDYLDAARARTQKHGARLILDEVISGFRFRAGDVGHLYGIQPDLATFGKAMGGGMPVSAVAGRADVMALVGREGEQHVKFSGGTYSAHPASLLAAQTMMEYLVEHEDEIYARLAELGEKARRAVEEAFGHEGVYARCTGYGNDTVTGSSLAMTHFPYDPDRRLARPEDVSDPDVCDVVMRERVVKLALLLENIHITHGLGSLTLAHTEEQIDQLAEACGRVARQIKPYL